MLNKPDSASNTASLLWATLLSIAWLLPNHFQPWTSFHSDAWLSFVVLLAGLVLFSTGRKAMEVHGLVVVFAVILFIPWIQFYFGIIIFAGKAWLASLYIGGFCAAMLIGARWTDVANAQPLDALFLAILIASIASCGLVVGLWFGVVDTGLESSISMGHSGARYYANLAQPNLLATFLLWGCCSGLWFFVQKKISGKTLVILCVLLGLCISLTGSRQAYVGGILSIFLIWCYRSKWTRPSLPYVSILFPLIVFSGGKFWAVLHMLIYPHQATLPDLARPVAVDGIRLQAWKLFFHASLEKPWFGFGWGEVTAAQLAVANKFPSLGVLFAHTHNLMLDFVVWVGFPVAILIISFLALWASISMFRIKNEQEVIVFLALSVFAVHSMLELPHQYAIFLFPVGIFMGFLNARLNLWGCICIDRRVALFFIIGLTIPLLLVVRDYFRVEDSYNLFRLEKNNIKYMDPEVKKIPDVLLLTQFKYWFSTVAYPHESAAMPGNILLQRQSVIQFPSSGAMFELGKKLVDLGNIAEAQYWFDTICRVSPEEECKSLKGIWSDLSKSSENYRLINWN